MEDDVARRLVERAYLSAISEHHVDAVGAPQLTPVRLDQEKPFAFEARVEVRPKVDPKDYRGLPFKRVQVAVTDAAGRRAPGGHAPAGRPARAGGGPHRRRDR